MQRSPPNDSANESEGKSRMLPLGIKFECSAHFLSPNIEKRDSFSMSQASRVVSHFIVVSEVQWTGRVRGMNGVIGLC